MEEGTHFDKHKVETGSLEAQTVFIGLGLDFTTCSAAAKGCSPRFLLADLVIKQPIKSGTPRGGFNFFQLGPTCALFPWLASSQLCQSSPGLPCTWRDFPALRGFPLIPTLHNGTASRDSWAPSLPPSPP